MDYARAYHSAAQNTAEARTRELALNLAVVHGRIDRAMEACGRTARPELMVVTKFFPADDVIRLYELGVRHIGENKDQEASRKFTEVTQAGTGGELHWHFIGQLQSNKAKSVTRYASSVHSVDRVSLIKSLEKAAIQARDDGSRDTLLDCLIQVDLRNPIPADGRGGATPGEIAQLAEKIADSQALRLAGLMAVAPLHEPAEPAFQELHALSEMLRRSHPDADQLSAGMSQDLEAAVACSATHLRIGRDVLGERPHPR